MCRSIQAVNPEVINPEGKLFSAALPYSVFFCEEEQSTRINFQMVLRYDFITQFPTNLLHIAFWIYNWHRKKLLLVDLRVQPCINLYREMCWLWKELLWSRRFEQCTLFDLRTSFKASNITITDIISLHHYNEVISLDDNLIANPEFIRVGEFGDLLSKVAICVLNCSNLGESMHFVRCFHFAWWHAILLHGSNTLSFVVVHLSPKVYLSASRVWWIAI